MRRIFHIVSRTSLKNMAKRNVYNAAFFVIKRKSSRTTAVLPRDFLAEQSLMNPEFGFNGLGGFTYNRTYSRVKDHGTGEKESFHDTITRVVEGTFSMQRRHMKEMGLPWDQKFATKEAMDMYERIFYMKFLPPGRGLWAMGSPVIEERGIHTALNNCGFVSTQFTDVREAHKPFVWLMECCMLGTGVGFDTKGHDIPVKRPQVVCETWVIPDSREGWVESLSIMLRGYFTGGCIPILDYSSIRAEGEPIKTFGGIAAGPKVLRDMHEAIISVLNEIDGKSLGERGVVDIMNLIGKCVVSGNVRRTAEIALGSANSEEFLNLKNYKINPERAAWGWTSNNSIKAEFGMDYTDIVNRIIDNGEPGIIWMENVRKYGRMNGKEDNYVDKKASGCNPCGFYSFFLFF